MPPTRKYEQRLRANAADQTRRRILDAVYRRLVEAPFEEVSMDKVANLAEVSRSTIYNVFGSRAALFDALGMDLLRRGGFTDMVTAVMQPDARAGLCDRLAGNVHMYAAHRDVLRALFSMAPLDSGVVGGSVRRLEQGRAEGMNDLAQRLHDQGALRDEVTVERAGHLLWLHTSFDAFDLLFTGRSLPAKSVAAILVDAAEYALCGNLARTLRPQARLMSDVPARGRVRLAVQRGGFDTGGGAVVGRTLGQRPPLRVV